MSDLEKYIQKREKNNPNFRKELEAERRNLRRRDGECVTAEVMTWQKKCVLPAPS